MRPGNAGVTAVVITGIASSIGEESTAGQAREAAFNVTLAADAMADLRPESHKCSVGYICPLPRETRPTRVLLRLLEPS